MKTIFIFKRGGSNHIENCSMKVKGGIRLLPLRKEDAEFLLRAVTDVSTISPQCFKGSQVAELNHIILHGWSLGNGFLGRNQCSS